MTFQKILLKTQDGTPVASATVTPRPPQVTLPFGVRALLLLSDGKIYPAEGERVSLVSDAPFSLLAKKGEMILFASTMPSKDADFQRRQLFSALRENREKAPTEPLKSPLAEDMSKSEKENGDGSMQQVEFNAPIEEETPPVTEVKNDLSKAEALLEKGEPFHLFDAVMPKARWALIKEDAAEYLVGITTDEEGEHVLFGVPGARDFPPDEGRVWSFFPMDGDEEIGYFLTEAGELKD